MQSNSNNIDNNKNYSIWQKIKEVTQYIIESPKIILHNFYNYLTTHNNNNSIPINPAKDYEALYNHEFKVSHNLKQTLHSCELHIITLKEEYKKSTESLEAEKNIIIQNIQQEKEALIIKNKEVIAQIENLIMELAKKNATILKLKEDLKSAEELTNLTRQEKITLENEALKLHEQLTSQSHITEREHKEYALKHKYMPPETAIKLQKDSDQIIKLNEQLQNTINIVKSEINKGYDNDVKISQKLVKYITDMKTISEDIVKLNNKLHLIITNKIELTRKITEQTNEISIYGIIDRKSQYNQKDIQELTERLTNIKNCERLIKTYQADLDEESNKESIINEKLKDQQILYNKRQELIVNQIQQWIEDKSNYYYTNKIPFNGEDDHDLMKYVEELKRIGKFPNAINMDKEKQEYTFNEYNHYIKERNYDNIVHTRQPEIVRFNHERALVVAKPSIKYSPKPQQVVTQQQQIQEKFIKDLNSKPVIAPAQQEMNDRLFKSLMYTRKPLTVGNTIRSMPYQPLNRGYQNTVDTKTLNDIPDVVD